MNVSPVVASGFPFTVQDQDTPPLKFSAAAATVTAVPSTTFVALGLSVTLGEGGAETVMVTESVADSVSP